MLRPATPMVSNEARPYTLYYISFVASFGYLPSIFAFIHLVKFLANTMLFNTTCKDYDSMNQHSHQSTRTTGPQGGLEYIYLCVFIWSSYRN